jgi:hypothetical protein
MNAGLSPKARSMSVNVGMKNKHLEGSAGVKGRKIKLMIYGHLWSVSVKNMRCAATSSIPSFEELPLVLLPYDHLLVEVNKSSWFRGESWRLKSLDLQLVRGWFCLQSSLQE